MRRFWPFRHLSNFGVTILICSGVGLIAYNIRNDKIFSGSPIVTQSLKIMNQNTTLKNLLGYPLVFSRSFSNTYSHKNNQKYYYFQVSGSKQSIQVELIANKKKVSELKKDINNIITLNSKITQYQHQLAIFLKTLQALQSSRRKSKQQLQEIASTQQHILQVQNQLFDMKNQKESLEKSCQSSVAKYYIPQLDLYAKSLKNQSPEHLISDNQNIYGIEQLIAYLPNRNKFNIIASNNKQKQKNKQTSSFEDFSTKYQSLLFNQGYIRNRIKEGLGEVSEQEIQSYGKHKTQLMYNNVNGGQRMLIIFAVFLCATFSLIRNHENRLQSIAGTTIEYTAQTFFKGKMDKHLDLLTKFNVEKNKIKFDRLYIGGKVGKNFKCAVDVNGFPGAQVKFEGSSAQSGLNLDFKKFQLVYKDGQQVKKIDLLV